MERWIVLGQVAVIAFRFSESQEGAPRDSRRVQVNFGTKGAQLALRRDQFDF